jgi:hypothetical protein
MATTPVQLDEETLIQEFVDQIPLPPGVKFQRVDQALDASGEPALRIYFSVSMKFGTAAKRLNALGALKDALREKIFAVQIPKWPFVHFLEVR